MVALTILIFVAFYSLFMGDDGKPQSCSWSSLSPSSPCVC